VSVSVSVSVSVPVGAGVRAAAGLDEGGDQQRGEEHDRERPPEGGDVAVHGRLRGVGCGSSGAGCAGGQ
jgi:hypothetical protein